VILIQKDKFCAAYLFAEKMGKPSLKKKSASDGRSKSAKLGGKPAALERSGSMVLDVNVVLFIDMAQGHKEEGNKLF
jgi:hypothetical protein